MEKHFCNYNQALALKELGFDMTCLASWNFYTNEFNYNSYPSTFSSDDVIQLPLKSQVFEWFRGKHNLRHNVMDFIDDITGIEWDYEIATIGTDLDERGNYIPLVDYSIDDETRKFKTYEEAESACIDKLIEIVKNK